jgi:hypothetical protein
MPNGSVTERMFCFSADFQREKQNKKYIGKLNVLWENTIITECPGYAEICTDGAK